MSEIAYFTAQDVAYVRSSQTPQAKAAIAEKLGFHFRQFPRHSSTFRLAVEIATLLQKDSNETVRQALAESVAIEQKTPAMLATLLATDEADAVAIPLLRSSPRLADAILLPLIQATHAATRLMAIAERDRLSSPACQALIEKKIQQVCQRVLELHFEMLDGNCYHSLVRDYGSNKIVMLQIRREASRRDITLPTIMQVAMQNLIASQVANEDSQAAITPEEMDVPSKASPYILHESGLLQWRQSMLNSYANFDKHGDNLDQWSAYAEELNREGALQAPTMLLALGLGLLPLFACGLARHSHFSTTDALAACHGSEVDFRELYQRAHLPSAMYKLCWWTLSSARELLARGVEPCCDEMQKSMARKLAQAEKLKVNFARTVGYPVMEALLTQQS
jgi:hypothetical protein